MTRAAAPAALLLALLVGAACPPPPRPSVALDHLGRAIPVADADTLLRRVLETNDGYGTLETVHRVTIEIALGEGRSEKRSFRALLAIRRPGHFRLHILGPMGIRLIDLLYERGRVRVVKVADELARSSRLPEILDSIAGDIATIYRLDPQPHPTSRKLEESVSLASRAAPLYELREYQGATQVRQLTIFAATLAISRVEEQGPGGEQRTVTYGDYRGDGKLVIPWSIHLSREGKVFYWLSVQVESATVDQKLDDRLFMIQAAPRRLGGRAQLPRQEVEQGKDKGARAAPEGATREG